MPLKFAANLSWLFTEEEKLEDRYEAAKNAGFQAVECAYPTDEPAEALARAREASGLQHVLINASGGETMGFAALTGRHKEFQESIEDAIIYAKGLKCPRIHILSGKKPTIYADDAIDETYVDNLKWAGKRLQQEGIIGLIEAVGTIPNYYMDHPEKAFTVVKQVNHPNIRMQLDLYHMQILAGNLTANLRKYLPYTDHIQISQVPERNEPMSEGEVNYSYIFKILEQLGYDGWIGLEYKPSGSTLQSLESLRQWMQ